MKDMLSGLDYDTKRDLTQLDYDYGDLGDLRPGSAKHDKIVAMVMDYAQTGYDNNTPSIPEMEKIDRILDGFMPADEVDNIRLIDDSRAPVSIINPMLYSHHQQFLAAGQRIYHANDALHRFKGGQTPERDAKAALAQKLLWQIGENFDERRAFDIHLSDAFAYPRAYMWGKWSKKYAAKKRIESVDEDLSMALNAMGVPYQPGDDVSYIDDDEAVVAEGTQWIPLDPYQVLVDRVTPDNFQQSAFFGWVADSDALSLVVDEEDPEEDLFNCRGLEILAKKAGSATSKHWRDSAARSEVMDNRSEPRRLKHSTRCHVVYMFCRLRPREFELGESNKPEVWFFAVGGDRVLIKAKRCYTLHGGIPVVCAAPNARGHQFLPVSNLGITYGQQIAVDFYTRQEMDYQDLVKNGKFIYDNTMIEWADFAIGGGPRGIRMKKRAMNRPIAEFFHEVQTTNATDNNYNKATWVMEQAREGSGLTEQASAMPDRPTARGINAIESRSVNRMARQFIIIDSQSRKPMARQGLCNVAQWMGSDVILDITGKDDEVIRRGYGLPPGATGLIASHWDIDPSLDVIPLSSMSYGGKDLAQIGEFGKVLMADPEVRAKFLRTYRTEEFLAAILREMGIPDLENFRYTISEMDNEMVLQQQQAGNIVSMADVAKMNGLQQ